MLTIFVIWALVRLGIDQYKEDHAIEQTEESERYWLEQWHDSDWPE